MSKTKYILSVCVLAAFALAACTQDELAEQGAALPEGAYPITFSAVRVAGAEPQTRVSENADGTGSLWTHGDKIEIEFSESFGDYEQFNITLTVDADGNIIAQSPQRYWPNTGNYTYNAIYCNIEGEESTTDQTVSFGDQSQGLAYVLLASGSANCHSGEIALMFKHKLNKVRVKLEDEKADEVASVSVKNYTSVNVSPYLVQGGTEGYIKMYKVISGDETYWEANVAPGAGTNPAQIQDFRLFRGDGTYVDCKLDAPIVLEGIEGGQMFTVTINVKSAVVQDGATLTEAGDYTMSGTYAQGVTINGDGINLTLDGATINTSGIGINITGGNPTIKVSGTENSVTSQTAAAINIGNSSTLTIEGVNGTADKLTVDGGGTQSQAVWGDTSDAGISVSSGASVAIKNVSMIAIGGNTTNTHGQVVGGSAAIGSTMGEDCGNITITDAVINATGGQNSPAIGLSYAGDITMRTSFQMGNITITHSDITATGGNFAAVIGLPCATLTQIKTISGGKITITTTDPNYLDKLTMTMQAYSGVIYPYKIGKGMYFSRNGATCTLNGGVEVNVNGTVTTSPDGIAQWTE